MLRMRTSIRSASTGHYAARFISRFATLTLAFFSASTGHFPQRDFDRQHFFLTLPAFVHFRT